MKGDTMELPVVMYEVTRRCNYDCRYCYNIWKGRLDGAEPPPDDSYAGNLRTLKRLFDSADIQHIGMTGGEPFLAERFAELVLFCRMQGASVAIVTNGSDHRQYHQMAELGVARFTLPLHAATAAIHDRMTGRDGSWFRSLHAIREAMALGVQVVASMILSAENHDQVEPVLRLARELGIKHMMINRFNIGGAGIRQARRLAPQLPQLRSAFATASRVGAGLGLSISSNVAVPHCLIDPDEFPHIHFPGCSTDPLRRPLTLESNGDLRACNHSPVVIGNIFEQDVGEILESPRMRCWQTTIPRFCNDCERYESCLGGCRAAAEQVGMSVGAVDPVLNCLASSAHAAHY